MVTAYFEYRDYVPYGYIAITYCSIDFYGTNAQMYNNKWHTEFFQNLYKDSYHELYIIDHALADAKNELSSLVENIKSSRCRFRFWYNKKEKAMINAQQEKIKQRQTQSNKLNAFIDSISVTREIDTARHFLINNGFKFINITHESVPCSKTVEVWTKDE